MRRRPSSRCPNRTLLLAVAFTFAVTACGGAASGDGEPVVDVRAPDVGRSDTAVRALEPLATPTPAPPTPTPTPAPTPTPLPPPRGASLQVAAGTQSGAPNSFCWTAQRGAPGECFDHPAPRQPEALRVTTGEIALLRLDAPRAPNEESIRAFKGSRAAYPSTRISPALETELTIDLERGEWNLDLCATWHGHGEPICWLFLLEVVDPGATG